MFVRNVSENEINSKQFYVQKKTNSAHFCMNRFAAHTVYGIVGLFFVLFFVLYIDKVEKI